MAIKSTFKQTYSVVLLIKQVGFTNPNSQYMSSNMDDLKSLHCDCAFVYLKYIWNACINIFMQMKEINIDGEEEKYIIIRWT